MMQIVRNGQAVLTVVEVGRMFGRSTTWVRNRIVDLQLQTLHPYGSSPVLITEASARTLLDEMRNDVNRASGGTLLRLVVDNTK